MLVMMVICLPTRCSGKRFIAIAIAASSAVYGFCSVLTPKVTEYVIGSLLITMPRLSWIAPPIPTIPFLADECRNTYTANSIRNVYNLLRSQGQLWRGVVPPTEL